MSKLTLKVHLKSGNILSLNGCTQEQFNLLTQPGPGTTILGNVVVNRSHIEYIQSISDEVRRQLRDAQREEIERRAR